MPTNTPSEAATLGGGCFWCLEAVFELLRGVDKVVSGYAGGHTPGPTYEQVCTGATGHAEVIQVRFDPTQITFRDLLDLFFVFHDPTTLNRQGADVGTQYRSVIFYENDLQKTEAERAISELSAAGVYRDPIVTQVVPLTTFYPAETYHQGYFQAHRRQGYCVAVIEPKVAKLRAKYLERLKPL